MTTTTIQSAKVLKVPRRLKADSWSYIAGKLLVTKPMMVSDSLKPTDAKGSLSNVQLRELAKKRVPPSSWLEGDEEPLF